MEAENNSRIAAGALNNPIIYDRYANGVTVSNWSPISAAPMNWSKAPNLHAKAQQENVITSRADVLLQVDQAYFDVLRAQAVLRWRRRPSRTASWFPTR